MSILGNLKVMLTAETADFQRDLKASGQAVTKFNDEAKKTGGAASEFQAGAGKISTSTDMIGSMFTKLIAAGVIYKGAQALIDFGKQSIQAASDVEEMSSKFTVVFGESAGVVEQSLGQMAEDLNRSKYDLMGYAATLQDTFVPLGFARDQAADMSVQVVQLAEDLASFNNLNTPDVVRDLQSALVGNGETMRKYGVVLNEATIQAEALNSGLWDGTGAMDAQTKAAATLNVILAGTADAQGDAARTADSYANVSKGLSAAFQELKVAFGQGFLPQVTEAKNVMTDATKGFTDWTRLTFELKAATDAGIISQTESTQIQWEVVLSGKTAAQALAELRARTEENTEATEFGQAMLDKARLAMDQYAESADGAAFAVDITEQATSEFAISLSDLKTLMAGEVGKEYDDFARRNSDLTGRVEELRAKISELEAKEYLTAEQKDELQIARDELNKTKEQVTLLADEHEESTRRILFAMLEQKLGTLGLLEESGPALAELAEKWGLIDEETRNAMEATAEAARIIEECGKDAETASKRVSLFYDVWSALNSLGQIKDFKIRVRAEFSEYSSAFGGETNPYGTNNTTYMGEPTNYEADEPGRGPGKAQGGTVFRGNRYWVGEHGPEPFFPAVDGRILSREDAMRALRDGGGRGVTINQLNLYGIQNAESLLAELDNLAV